VIGNISLGSCIIRVKNSSVHIIDFPPDEGGFNTILKIAGNHIWIFYKVLVVLLIFFIMYASVGDVIVFAGKLNYPTATIFISITALFITVSVSARINIAA